VETKVLEAEEATTPGAQGLRSEADTILQQLDTLKLLIREVAGGVLTGLKIAL